MTGELHVSWWLPLSVLLSAAGTLLVGVAQRGRLVTALLVGRRRGNCAEPQ